MPSFNESDILITYDKSYSRCVLDTKDLKFISVYTDF